MIPATEDGDIELTSLSIWSPSITSSCTGQLVTSSSKFIGEGLDEESSFIGCSRLPWLFCVGFSSNISCFAEDCFLHTSVVARFDGCLEDGDNSVQRFTEHFCSSSSTIWIFLLFCLKSLTLETNASHFLQTNFEKQSSSRITTSQASKIFSVRFLPHLP